MVGTGIIGRSHLAGMAGRTDTVIAAICEPRPDAADLGVLEVTSRGRRRRASSPTGRVPRAGRREERLDAVVIFTRTRSTSRRRRRRSRRASTSCSRSRWSWTRDEAVELIRTRDRTGRLLVVAFNGSLSPRIRAAAAMIKAGQLGAILNVNALVWQDWRRHAEGTWRTDPAISGGGFMFDTGAHMLNTVADLAGEDVTEVAAWLEDDGAAVDIRGAVIARLGSGALITMNGCGRAIPSIGSDIRVFCERGTLRTGIGASGWTSSATGATALRPVRSVRPSPSGTSSSTCGPAASPTRARPRSGCAWRGCGTRSASRLRRRCGRAAGRGGGRRMTTRVTVWNEYRQEHPTRRSRRSTRTGSTGRSPTAARRGLT